MTKWGVNAASGVFGTLPPTLRIHSDYSNKIVEPPPLLGMEKLKIHIKKLRKYKRNT